jgi:ribonuclease T1
VFRTGSQAAEATPPGRWPRGLRVPGLRGDLAVLVLASCASFGTLLAPAMARSADIAVLDDTVALGALPPEARKTHRLILAGGPFEYEKDGTVFFNRERLLPSRPRGQYREYTVRTPGLSHRGARRIVCGGLPPTQPETCFYTADHYASFKRIQP